MVAVISISFILVGVSIVIAIGRRFFFVQSEEKSPRFVPLKAISLFEPDEKMLAAIERAEHRLKSNEECEKLLAWASLITFEALPETQIEIVENQKSWDFALEILTDRAEHDEDVCALVSFVVHNPKLNVNQKLVNKFQAVWKTRPTFRRHLDVLSLLFALTTLDYFKAFSAKPNSLSKPRNYLI